MKNSRHSSLALLWSLSVAISTSISSTVLAAAIDIQLADAPTNDLNLTVTAIQTAKRSLLLNIYELTSPAIADALADRIRAGVDVSILEEGQPVGGLSAAAKGIQAQLTQEMQKAGGNDHLFEMTSKATPKTKRRFRWDHAKYAVIDDEYLLVGSENYSPTGNPEPATLGNRGWEAFIHDAQIANEFTTVFTSDSSMAHGDVLELTGGKSLTISKSKPAPAPNPAPVSSDNPLVSASAIALITSPETSESGLLAAINGARKTIDIEQMTFDSAWGKGQTSPLLDAVLAAGKRGVQVRVLLNDERVFNHPSHPAKPKNVPTIDTLNQEGAGRITAMTANLKAMHVDYIHNKGMLIDGDKTLISSINWDMNAVTHNREAAVLITSPEAYAYYEGLFQKDWQASGGAQE